MASIHAAPPLTAEEVEFHNWLGKADVEPVLEPEIPICDPHHHLWDRERKAAWDGPVPTAEELPKSFVRFFGRRSPEYNQRFLFDELLEALRSGHNVVSTVFAQCGRFYSADSDPAFAPVGETAVVRGVQAQFESGLYTNEFGSQLRACAAGFGSCDLTIGKDRVEAVLRAHMAAMPGFAGIRTGGDYGSQEFREGFAVLEKLGLTFDHFATHHKLPDLVELAKAFPGVTIICDHCGGPFLVGRDQSQRDAIFAKWKLDMQELAKCANVFMKVGGMNMPFAGFGWELRPKPPSSEEMAGVLGPWYRFLIDTFGASRCMFESNFPPDNATTTYRTLWNTFKIIAASYTTQEKAALFHDTAVRVYKIGQARHGVMSKI